MVRHIVGDISNSDPKRPAIFATRSCANSVIKILGILTINCDKRQIPEIQPRIGGLCINGIAEGFGLCHCFLSELIRQIMSPDRDLNLNAWIRCGTDDINNVPDWLTVRLREMIEFDHYKLTKFRAIELMIRN